MQTKTMLRPSLIFSLGLLTLSVMAFPKSFEGIITYKISYPDSKFTESQLAMFPKVMTIMIKGDKAKQEIQTQMGNQIEITDYTAKTKIGLINMMGQKYAIQQTAEELQKELQQDPVGEVTLTKETKTIAGHICKKALVTVNEDGIKTALEVWYSDEFDAPNPNFDKPTYKDIPGVLMEFVMIQPQLTMKFTAISVEKKNVSNKEFEIPSDYTITTLEELRSKMGGMQ